MATREDAQLLVQVLQWGNGMGLEEAMQHVFSKDYDPETAPMDDPAVAKVLSFGETLGTFVKHGVLDRELVVDLVWVEGLWRKVRRHALAAREEEHEPRLYEHFEALVGVTAGVARG